MPDVAPERFGGLATVTLAPATVTVLRPVCADPDGDPRRPAHSLALAERSPQSIVVHAEPMTATGPGEAGMAGDRLACLDMPLE